MESSQRLAFYNFLIFLFLTLIWFLEMFPFWTMGFRFPKNPVKLFGGCNKADAKDPIFMEYSWRFMGPVNRYTGLDNYIIPVKVLRAMTGDFPCLLEVIFCESNRTKTENMPSSTAECILIEGGKRIIYFLNLQALEEGWSMWTCQYGRGYTECTRIRELNPEEKIDHFETNNYKPIYETKCGPCGKNSADKPIRLAPKFEEVDPTNPDCLNEAWLYAKTISDASNLENHIIPIEVMFAEKGGADYNMEVIFKEINENKKDFKYLLVKREYCTVKDGGQRFIYRLHIRYPRPLEPYEPEHYDMRFKLWRVRNITSRDSLEIRNYIPFGEPIVEDYNFNRE